MLHTAAIALGSNLSSSFGDPAGNVLEAARRLATVGRVVAISSLRETDPVGYLDQPRFVNGAALLETELDAVELLRALLDIERQMGRDRTGVPAKGPRVIDLDLIFFDDLVMTSAELTLPHPAMHERRFVLEPLAEIAPEWAHPVLGRSVAEMLRGLAPQANDGATSEGDDAQVR